MRFLRSLPTLLAAFAALTLAACGDSTATTGPPTTDAPPTTAPDGAFDREAARADLERARARWADVEPVAYRFRYVPMCFCPREEVELVVLDQVRVMASTRDEPWGHVYDWFGEIELAIPTAYDLHVDYDDRGVPVSISIDQDPNIADEEFGIDDVELTPITDILSEVFTHEYGCGYGIWAAAPTQQAAIMFDVGQTTEPVTYQLADQKLAELRLGHGLMANWCDDVIEPDEPEPEVQEVWKLVGGTIQLVAVSQSSARAELRDVIARRPDGSDVVLGDATMTNRSWGVFAG